jgi:hypothetical protein
LSEPTAALPLRWGGYRLRYGLALTLILAGGLLVQAGSVYAGYFITGGIAIHLAGWLVLPAKGVRRVIIALPSAIFTSALLFGSLGSVLLALCLLGWLWARQRPLISYPVLVLPVACGVILFFLFPQYGNGATVVGVSLLVVVGSAWLARAIAGAGRFSSPTR